MKRIAVLGIGEFGFHIASALYDLGNDVLAVDISSARIQDVADRVTKAIVADVSDREALEELNIRDVDVAVVAVGGRLEVSVLLTHYLRELGIPRILTKVSDNDQSKILKLIGATEVIFPERFSAIRTAYLIHFSRLVDGIRLSGDSFVVAMRIPLSFTGHTVEELELQKRYSVQLIAVKPAVEDRAPFIPDPLYRLLEDDVLIVMGEIDHLVALQSVK